jgi:SAM-dependent methyltransferase
MTADYFDRWFTDIAASGVRQQIFAEHLGVPEEVGPSNLVPLEGLREIAAALAVGPGHELVDLACGRGGPGMWIARETGARLVGVDFSPTAVEQASTRRALFGLQDSATFVLGAIEDTGLPTGSADAMVCVDAFQFAADRVAAGLEMKRVLRPGGRVVLTSWEAAVPGDEQLGERIRSLDVAASLAAAGLRDVVSEQRPRWHEVGRRMWSATLSVDPAGDAALQSMHAEAERSLANHDRMRRVMATAVAP